VKRREPAVLVPTDEVPAELRAGRCLEVWSPDVGDWQQAFMRWGHARSWWLMERGVPQNDHRRCPRSLRPSGPWSFRKLLESGHLPEALERRSLPLDWTPADSLPEARRWIARGRP
jgi:hypothetical protein